MHKKKYQPSHIIPINLKSNTHQGKLLYQYLHASKLHTFTNS